MDALELMTHEHTYIKRGLLILRKLSINILNGEKVDYTDFTSMIDFIRNYADKHHHSKEEEILFKMLVNELGGKVANGPLSGMYIEHDLGRLYVKSLEDAVSKVLSGDGDARVDVIANAIGYADLLTRHIDKEDKVIYNFAKRSLNDKALKELQEKCDQVERIAEYKKLQEHYIGVLCELEGRIIGDTGK